MTGVLQNQGVSVDLPNTVALKSDVAALAAQMPAPATAMPPAVNPTGALGDEQTKYALANHTHASRARRARLQTVADGSLTWTYPTPFDVGVVPQIQAIAETAVGVTDVVNVQVEGTPTNTSCVIRVTRTQRSVVALIGLTVLSLPSAPGATWVHLSAFG